MSACERCQGEGQVIATPCKECHGQGQTQTVQRLNVAIPAGVDEGQQIRLTGQGQGAPKGGSPGDLYVFISVAS